MGLHIGYFCSENAFGTIQRTLRLTSSHHHMCSPNQNTTWLWKQVAAVTEALQQSLCNQPDTQEPFPNKGKELLRNKLVKSLSLAAEKHFRKRVRRHQRNMPTAFEISDDSD